MRISKATSRVRFGLLSGLLIAVAVSAIPANAAVDPRSFFAGPRTSASPEILDYPFAAGEALVVFARSVKPSVAHDLLRAAGAERSERQLVPGL
jgi:hypothetical protein